MFSRALVAVVLATLGVVAQSGSEKPFALQTPGEFVQCKNTTLVWQGGRSPYKVTIKPTCGAGQNATEEQHVVLVPGATSIEFPVTLPAGTPVTVSITDSDNMQATAPAFDITSGDANDSCTLQTACNSNAQAPSVPVALAPETSNTPVTPTIPTDHLLTVDPTASTTSESAANSEAVTSDSTTMVVVYSYVSQTSPATTSTPSSSSQNNAAVPVKTAPVVVLGRLVLVGANLALSFW